MRERVDARLVGYGHYGANPYIEAYWGVRYSDRECYNCYEYLAKWQIDGKLRRTGKLPIEYTARRDTEIQRDGKCDK